MIKSKKKKQVQTLADVQNIVTSVIFSQTSSFTKEDICRIVELNLKYSPFGKHGKKRKEIDVDQKVSETLNVLWINQCVVRSTKDGTYKLSMGFPPYIL